MSLLRSIWKFTAGLFAAIVILLALVIGLFRLLLPLAPDYQDQIEAWASELLNAPVEIDRLDARWRFGGPELVIEGVRVMDEEDALLLEIARGSVGISALHWLRTREIRPGRVILDGLAFEVERLDDGTITVSGRPLVRSGEPAGTRKLPNGRFELTNASITYTDHIGGPAPYRFTGIDLNLEIESDLVRADGNLQLPDALGRELELSLELSGRRDDPKSLSWQFYAEGDQVALPGWAAFLPDGMAWFADGSAKVEVWAGMRGTTLEQASLQFQADTIGLGSPDAGDSVRYEKLSARGEWNRSPRGWEAAVYDFAIEKDGQAWASPATRVEYATSADDGTDVLYASADLLLVEDLTPFVVHLGPADWAERIVQLDPEGTLRGLQLRLSRRSGDITDYLVRCEFDGLGANAVEPWPGARGLSGDLRADTSSGRLELGSDSVTLEDPARFREPVALDAAEGTVVWRSSTSGLRLVSDRLVIRNADFSAVSSVELNFPSGEASPVVDLRMTATDVNLASAPRYLPAGVMKPKLLGWLDNAVRRGVAPSVQFVLAGPLAEFPFEDGGGRFHVRAALRDLDMLYARDWPLLVDIDGEAVFSGPGLEVTVDAGSISDNVITSGMVRIEDLRKLVIEVQAQADSGIVPTLTFLNDSPLREKLGAAVGRLSGTGDGPLDVSLILPMKDIVSRDVRVGLGLDDATFLFDGFDHPLDQIRGQLRFQDNELRAEDVEAMFVGRPVSLNIAPESLLAGDLSEDTETTGATLIVMDGMFNETNLADMILAPLARVLEGESLIDAVLRVPSAASGERLTISVTSSLEGMAVTLPEPMAKAADVETDLSVQLEFLDEQLIDMALAVGDVRGNLEIRRVADSWQTHRGNIALGSEPGVSGNETGIAITGRAETLDLAGWLALDLGMEDARPLEQTFRSMTLDVAQLDFFGQPMRDARVAADRSQREWLVQLSADLAEGVLFVPYTIGESAPVIARFDRLGLTAGDPASASDPGDPRRIPPIVLEVADFRYDKMQLGNLKAEVRPTERGVRMDSLATQAPSFEITGEGDWFLTEDGHQSVIDVNLVSTDLDATLKALDFESSLDADETEILLSLNWPDSPGPRFREKLNGEVRVRVGPGRLVSVQPGAGRVFGLLSVTALPRRLSLDFRDVFDSGFGFDFIRGDFSLRDGNAYTTNLVLEGPAAQVGVMGRAGLVTRDYDQTAVVYANFGSTLPVAGAVVGGPAVGAALLVFSELFKKPLQEMARVNYRITGSWEDPQIERVLASDLGPNDNAGAP